MRSDRNTQSALFLVGGTAALLFPSLMMYSAGLVHSLVGTLPNWFFSDPLAWTLGHDPLSRLWLETEGRPGSVIWDVLRYFGLLGIVVGLLTSPVGAGNEASRARSVGGRAGSLLGAGAVAFFLPTVVNVLVSVRIGGEPLLPVLRELLAEPGPGAAWSGEYYGWTFSVPLIVGIVFRLAGILAVALGVRTWLDGKEAKQSVAAIGSEPARRLPDVPQPPLPVEPSPPLPKEEFPPRPAASGAAAPFVDPAPLPAVVSASGGPRGDVSIRFCPHCGARVVAAGRFCASCGAELGSSEARLPAEDLPVRTVLPPPPPSQVPPVGAYPGPAPVNVVLPGGLLSTLTTCAGSSLIVVSFFAPWIRTWLGDVSAAELASAGAWYLYSFPVLAAAAAILALLRRGVLHVLGLLFGVALAALGGWLVSDVDGEFRLGWGFILCAVGALLVLGGHSIGLREHYVRGRRADGLAAGGGGRG